jgi:hypothetical protein
MGIVFASGFDYMANTVTGTGGLTSILDGYANSSYVQRGAGRYLSGYSIEFPTLGSISRWALKAIPASATHTVGFAFYIGSGLGTMSGNCVIGQWTDAAGTDQCTLVLKPDGTLAFYRGYASVSLGASAAGVVASNGWYYVECSLTISDTAGTFDIHVDGVSVASGSGLDTKASASLATADKFYFGGNSGVSPRPLMRFDDMYIRDDLTFMGPLFFEYLPPTADTATKDFTRSAGADNYALLDELTGASVTDYTESSGAGATDIFDFGSLSSTPTAIHLVQTVVLAQKTEAGTRTFRSRLKQSATFSNGVTATPQNSWLFTFDKFLVDPVSGIAFTGAGVTSLQAGYEIVT